jgi:hypothetical protein
MRCSAMRCLQRAMPPGTSKALSDRHRQHDWTGPRGLLALVIPLIIQQQPSSSPGAATRPAGPSPGRQQSQQQQQPAPARRRAPGRIVASVARRGSPIGARTSRWGPQPASNDVTGGDAGRAGREFIADVTCPRRSETRGREGGRGCGAGWGCTGTYGRVLAQVDVTSTALPREAVLLGPFSRTTQEDTRGHRQKGDKAQGTARDLRGGEEAPVGPRHLLLPCPRNDAVSSGARRRGDEEMRRAVSGVSWAPAHTAVARRLVRSRTARPATSPPPGGGDVMRCR